jgi:hypothetical protein
LFFKVKAAAALVLLCSVVVPGSLPSAAANDVALPPVTDADDRWGFNAIPTDATWLRLARDAGARWTRAEFRWDRLEGTRGQQSWAEFDRLVNTTMDAGISVQGILIGTPDWAKDPRGNFLPQGINLPHDNPQNLWTRYVREVVTRYKGKVRYWEVWNEPDYAEVFWAGTTADYYQMLKVSYQTIKAIDPDAKVLMAGLAYYYKPDFLEELIRIMMADPTGRTHNYYFDILAWHTYSGSHGIRERVADTRRLLGPTVGMRPIWLNETNVPPWDESRVNYFRPFTYAGTTTEQAAFILQTFAYAVVDGVEKVFVYRLNDDPTDGQAWGLVRDNGTFRPAYAAYQVAAKHLSRVDGGRVARQGNVEQVVAGRPGERISVVWNRTGSPLATRVGAAATSATVTDMAGNSRLVQPTLGQYRLDLAAATAKADNSLADYMIGGAPLVVAEAVDPARETAQETSPLIGYSGAWSAGATPAAGVTHWRTAIAGASASIDFEGTNVTWVASRGPDGGIARVSVDGALLGEIDLYSPTIVEEEPFTFGEFESGSHRLTVTATGRRRGSSIGALVALDAFQGPELKAAPLPRPPSPPAVTPPSPPPPGARPQAAAHGAVPAPAARIALPVVMRERNGWTTSISLENAGDEDASGTIRFLNEAGAQVATHPFSLTTVGSLRLDPRSIEGLPDGFAGSVDIQSTQPVAASVTEIRDGTDAQSYAGTSAGSERISVPLLFKGYNGWDSTLSIQNLGDTSTPVTVTYNRTDSTGAPWTEAVTVPARASVTLTQSTNASLPAGFAGSAVVSGPSGANLAAVVNTLHTSGAAASYESVGIGGVRLNAPLLFKEAGGWNTGLQVQNVGSRVTQVTVTYRASSGAGEWREQASIGPGAAVTLYQPANAQLPNGFVGSAIVTSNNAQPLVGIVNAVNSTRGNAMAYVALGDGAPMLTTPFMARNSDGWTTGLQVQNLGVDPTNVTLLLQDPGGVLLDSYTESNIAPGASRTFFLPAMPNVPEGWRGSATVVSTTGAPLGAIVSETRF